MLAAALLGACSSAAGPVGQTLAPDQASASAPPSTSASVTPADASAAVQTWTPQLMASARPLVGPTRIGPDSPSGTPSPVAPSAAPPSGAPTASRLSAASSSAAPLPVTLPYTNTPYKIEGRLFVMVDASEPMYCGATVIHSPNRNLVWTAGHCVQGGLGKTFYQSMVFVPDYNGSADPSDRQVVAPYGIWAVKMVGTSKGWVLEGGTDETAASFVDYAAVSVYPNQNGQELEDVVGTGASLTFDVNPGDVTDVTAVGYPASSPYTGGTMYTCTAPVRRFSDPAVQGSTGTAAMWSIDCSLGQEGSGGGWFATIDGKPVLISDTALADPVAGQLFGPFLAGPSGQGAEALYEQAVRTFSGGPNLPSTAAGPSGGSPSGASGGTS